MNIKNTLFRFFLQIKTRSLGEEIIKFLSQTKTVLDFGCGNMLITEYVQQKVKTTKVIGVDVLDLNLTNLKPVLYNGKKLPFKNKEFDLVYTIFVLHHCDNEVTVLAEMLRVAQKAVVIEEIYDNNFEKYITYVHDWVMNHIESWDINVPLHFHTDLEWKEVFKKIGWKVINEKRVYQMPIWFTKQKMYVLERI